MKEAVEVFLMWYGFEIEIVNVLEDPALSRDFAESVPQAFIDGKLACKHRMEPARFARMLEEAGAGRARD